MTLIDRIASAAARHPTRIAVWAGGETITYAELMERGERIATTLLDAGVLPGDRVAILATRGLAAYIGVVAALRAGCTYVPLNVRYPLARNRRMLELSRATALVTDRSVERFAELKASVRISIDAERDTLDAVKARTSWPVRSPDDDCYVIFTSGSTGEPKGVPITHHNVLEYLRGITELAPVTYEDRITQLADLSFDLSVQGLVMALSAGAALYCIPEQTNLLATRFVEEHELTVWISVPSAAGLAKQAGLLEPGSLPSLRASHFCGEALHGAVAAAWAAAAPNTILYNLYGPTEATVEISWYVFGSAPDDASSIVAIGVPFRGQQMEVFGSDDRKLPDGEVGEILLAGSQLTRGYWEAPELDAAKFKYIDGTRWYRTGDLARRTAKGFEYVGRLDQQTKILGFRVELLEIERALRKVLGRDGVAVVAWPVTEDGGAEGTVAFVATAAFDVEPALGQLRALLPPYMVPARILFVDTMPLNANGKTDYKVLRALL